MRYDTGSATAITVDGDDVVAVIGHLPDPAETRKAGPATGPSDDDSPHREPAATITQGHGSQLDCRPDRRFGTSDSMYGSDGEEGADLGY
jgi:hypothetical protein